MNFRNSYCFSYLTAVVIFFAAQPLLAQSSYDPSTSATFSQATAGMSVVNSFTFGTNAGSNITNLSQLATNFNPYGIAKQTVIHTEWERYQPFNSTNFVFTPSSLNLTATIASGGGLYPGGISSGQIWSKLTFQPGKTGSNVYALSARIKIPSGTGMWPSFWLFSPSAGDASEIDAAEFQMMTYQNQFDWTGNNHGGGGQTIYSILSNPWTWHPGTDFSAAYHDYQVVWTPDATYKYVDGVLILAQTFQWTSNQPAQVGINLAVGSNDSGNTGLIPNSLSEFPAALQLASLTLWGGNAAAGGGAAPAPTGSSAAQYQGLDTTTQGSFTPKYGNDGYVIPNGVTGLPSYATLSAPGASQATWAAEVSDVRALQDWWGASTRSAKCFYSPAGLSLNLNLTDGNTHKISLYLLDWDNLGRSETIVFTDSATGAVLSSQNFANFGSGQWAQWNVKGNVIIKVMHTGNGNSVLSGIFFR